MVQSFVMKRLSGPPLVGLIGLVASLASVAPIGTPPPSPLASESTSGTTPYPWYANSDPVRAIQNEPGMVRSPLDAGWLLVRGGDPEDTAIYVDGVRVPLLYHLGGFTSIVHPEMVDTVEFWPGAYPAKLGNSISGAVNLEPRDVGDDVRMDVGVNLIYASAFVETPIPKVGGLAVAVRRSYLDGILTAVLDADRARIAPRFWDWQARIEGESGGLFTMGFTDQIDAPTGEDDETVTITVGTQRFHGRYEADFSEQLSLLVQPMMTCHHVTAFAATA